MTTTVRHVKFGFCPDPKFGLYPDPPQIKAGPVTISPLPDLERITSDEFASGRIEKNWIYAPHTTRMFELPKTHLLEHAAATSEEHLEFHLWALSFFVGMRLTATEAGFLDSTPVKPGKLVDFVLLRSSLDRAVELAEKFWKRTSDSDKPRCAKRFEAAVHALFLSQNPQNLQFEKFVLLYMAIDACYKLAVELYGLPQCSNNKRIELVCKQFEIECPGWADPNAPGGSKVAWIRNNTVHEALFMDAPLGFAVHGGDTNQNLPLEMQALVCRLLVALIGGSGADYVRSPVNTRQRHGLDLSELESCRTLPDPNKVS